MNRELYRNVFRGLPDSPQMRPFKLDIRDLSPMSSLTHTLLGASLTNTPRKRLSLSSSMSDTPKSLHEMSTSSGVLETSEISSMEKSRSTEKCRLSPKNKENMPTPYYSPSHGSFKDRRTRLKSPLKDVQNTVNRNLSFSPLKKPISPSRREHLSPVKKPVLVPEECDSNSRDSGYSESGQKRYRSSSDESDQKKDDGFSIPRSSAPTRRLNLDMSPPASNGSVEGGRKLRSFASLTAGCDEDIFLMDFIGADTEDDSHDSHTSSFSSLLSAPIQKSTTPPLPSDVGSCPASTCHSSNQKLPIRRCLSMVDATSPLIAGDTSTPVTSRVKTETDKPDKSTTLHLPVSCSPIGCSFKRPQPPTDSPCPLEPKRRRSEMITVKFSLQGNLEEQKGASSNSSSCSSKAPLIQRQQSSPESSTEAPPVLKIHRSHSETHVSIMRALNISASSNGEETGDFSRLLILPFLRSGKHPDLKSISVHTMADLIKGEYKDKVASFEVLDCRYPYEYEGGHIINARNLHHPGMVQEILDACEVPPKIPKKDALRHILIFHCEFSAERGPKAQRLLREFDRTTNKEYYPALHFPELYLLEGGYKAFYEMYPDICVPNKYVKMLDEKHSDDLKFFRSKSKSWASENKQNKARGSISRTGPKRLGL